MGPKLVDYLLYEPEDSGILWIKFNRPDRMNALIGTSEENGTVAKVGEYMRAGDDDPNIRVIVLTGVWRGFCSGANLGARAPAEITGENFPGNRGPHEGPDAARQHFFHGFTDLHRDISLIRKPTIAMVNGPAVGSGMDMALHCDIRIGCERTRFIGYHNAGQIIENGGSYYLPKMVGLGRALEFAYIGELDAEGAIDYVYGRSLISSASSSGAAYISQDGGGNTSSVSNNTGALNAAYEYDPWGKLLDPIDPLGSKIKYKFAGQEFDSAAGLYYMRARYYDPSVGQFLSRDPLGRPQGRPMDQNVYAYARNSPLRFSDPSGLVPESLLQQDLKYWDITYGGRGLRARNPVSSSGGLCRYTSILGTGVGPCITGTIQGYWYQDDYGNQLYGQMYVPYPQYGSVNGYWYTDQWGNQQYGYNVWDATDGSITNYQALPSWDDVYSGGFGDTGNYDGSSPDETLNY